MSGRKLLVIIDGGSEGDRVAEWQRRALATLPAEDRLTLLVCTNTRIRREPLRFPLYYALNLVAVRNRLTRSVPLGALAASIEQRIEFASNQDGLWQVLPQEIIDLVTSSSADAVIKLGMGLMRVPPQLAVPILSWHHGDPEHFRGRPAAFWEMLADRRVIGQVVQVISNKLDAGLVVAFAETRTIPHSWRATLIAAFRHSPLLLAPALENALAGRSLPKLPTGRNYRLPSNVQVARLVWRLTVATIRRLVFGALFEKRWRVSRAQIASADDAVKIATGRGTLPPEPTWWSPPLPPGCSFIADPFFGESNDEVLVEALSRWSGKGEIHLIGPWGSKRLSSHAGHHSYPALVEHQGETLCVPEIAQWSDPVAFRWRNGWEAHRALDIVGSPRLTDPTFRHHHGRLYLFANDASWGSGVLKLWSADGLFDQFVEHPASPLRISPRGSRMGGALLSAGGQLYRIGQDYSQDYGSGLILFSIDEMTPDSYREREVGNFRFEDRKGPHSFNLAPDGKAVVFDWYRDGFTPMAGIRRVLGRLRRG